MIALIIYLQSKYYNNILLLEVILVKLAQVLCCMRRIQIKMAAYISSSSTPKINWVARDMSLEYLNCEDTGMCEMMFYGPMMDCLNNEEAKFAHMSLWRGSKAIKLFNNSSLSMHKSSANLLRVIKDYCCKDVSAEEDNQSLPDLFNDVGSLQETINNDIDDDLFCLEDNEHFNELSYTRSPQVFKVFKNMKSMKSL